MKIGLETQKIEGLGSVTCDQVYFSLDRAEKVRLIQFPKESSASSPESGFYSDWPKNNGALGASL